MHRYCGNPTAFIAGDCDIDMKIEVQIARDSIMFYVSNFTDRDKSIWFVVWWGSDVFSRRSNIALMLLRFLSDSFLEMAKERTWEEASS